MKKLFTNDKFFGAVTILAILCTVFFCGMNYLINIATLILSISYLVEAICIAVLFVSYKNHRKNVMKGMMGALLMQMFTMSLMSLEFYFGLFDQVITILIVLIIAALFINHFVINSTRAASPSAIRFNQILCVLFAVLTIADDIQFIIIDETLLEKLTDVFNAVASICVAAAVVCVESRLDAYRLDREAAGWTEEKGYPENYVHEYEKK